VQPVPWLAWVVLVLAWLEAGWLAFDGVHALTTGDYVTPHHGRHAGHLGPWSKLVAAVGIDPRGIPMKTFHLVFGLVWLGVSVSYAPRQPWGWWAMLLGAIGGLWYLPLGTLASAVQIVLLLWIRSHALTTPA